MSLYDAHFEAFISERVAAGRYGSVSEMVRAGLRMLEVEENTLMALQAVLVKGEESGIVENFDIDEFPHEMDEKFGTE